MAKKVVAPDTQRAVLRISRADARAQLTEQIERGNRLLKPANNPLMQRAISEHDYIKWDNYNRELLGQLFSTDKYVQEYDFLAYSPITVIGPGTHAPDWHENIPPKITFLESLVERLRIIGEPTATASSSTAKTDASASTDVFIVHGHDSPAKTEVARLIERAGLRAVILHEQPNSGRTIIEKFEDHAGVSGFAVVIATPDDIGGPSPLLASSTKPRARQNVIAEMGWFAGRLGRRRVCVLKKGDIEMPSDFAGVGYTEMDDNGAWKIKLLKELRAADYSIDWDKATA